MTLAELLASVYRDLGEPSSPATATATRITGYINEASDVLLGDPAIGPRMLAFVQGSTSGLTLTSTASSPRLIAPGAVGKVLNVVDRTNDRKLEPMTYQEYRDRAPDPTAYTGTPSHYVTQGRVAIATLPSNGSELFVKSTSASDNTQTLVAELIRSGGYRIAVEANLNGVTAVTLSAAVTDVVDVLDWWLTGATVGTVTLHEDSGLGAELARIPIGAARPRYTSILLWPTPAAALDYTVDYTHQIHPLVSNVAGDEPTLPLEFHYLLSTYALMRHFGDRADDTRYNVARERWEKGVRQLRWSLASNDPIQVVGRSRRVGISRLGGYYPADTWIS